VSPDAYELEMPGSIWIHRVQPVSLLDPVVKDPLEGQVIPPPPPVEVDEKKSPKYPVLGIVGCIGVSCCI